MQMSRTWQRRLQRGKRAATAAGKPLVLGLAALAGLNMVWQFLFGAPPDLVTPSREVVNKSAVVSAFGKAGDTLSAQVLDWTLRQASAQPAVQP